ncbi:DUF7064 domain-containing protein [Haliea atlantica]
MYDLNSLSRPSLFIDPVNDGRHKLENKPLARESIPYIVVLPEHKIAFFTYTWVDKDSNAGAALAVFGPGVGDKPIQQKLADRPVPADMDFDNWQIEGFSMKQDLNFDKAEVVWNNDKVALNFSYEAYHPAYAYSAHKDGCPDFVASNRIEQSGLVKGELTFGGKTINFEATGHRDHSWGTRDWATMMHYHWFVGQTTDGVSVHFWNLMAQGTRFLHGYVFKDNVQAQVSDVEIDVEFDDQYLQKSFVAKVTDELGRVTDIAGEFFGVNALVPDERIVLNEGGGAATFDGVSGAGWLEVQWHTTYLEHVRKMKASS